MKFLICLLSLFSLSATAAPVIVNYTFTRPTLNSDGSTLTAAQITKYQTFAQVGVIADSPAGAPQSEPAGTATSGSVTIDANPGDIINVRMRTCTAAGCGALTNAATKVVPALPLPNAPNNLTITITISLP